MKILFKSLGFLFAALFIISSVLQYNDPDPYVWMVIWGIAGLISLGFALNKIPYQIPLVAGVLAFIGFFYSYPEKFEGFEIGAGDIKNVEEGREAFGLLIIGIVVLTFAVRLWYARKLKSEI